MAEPADFQADLIRLLRNGVHGDELRRQIRERHPERYAEWVEAFDPRAEYVAQQILKRWARPTE